jgi:hypothetical protein
MPQAAAAASQAAFDHQAWALQQQLEQQRQLALRQQQLAEQLQQHRQARLLLQQQLMATQRCTATAAVPASCGSMGMGAAASGAAACSMPMCVLQPAAATANAQLPFAAALLPATTAGLRTMFGAAHSNIGMPALMQQQQLVFPNVPTAPMPAPFLAGRSSCVMPVTNTISNMPVSAGDNLEDLMTKLTALRNEFQAMESSLLQLQGFQCDASVANAAAAAAAAAASCGASCAGTWNAAGAALGYQQQQSQSHAQCWQQQQQQQQVVIGSCGVFSNGNTFFV